MAYRLKLTPEQCGGFIPLAAVVPLIAGLVTAGVAIKNNIDNNNAKKKELEELARHHRKIEESINSEPVITDVSGKLVNKDALYEMYPEKDGKGVPLQGFASLKTSDFTERNMRDCIPSPLTEKYGVINYDDASGKGTHWVCFYTATT